jgi:hypothetical protein
MRDELVEAMCRMRQERLIRRARKWDADPTELEGMLPRSIEATWREQRQDVEADFEWLKAQGLVVVQGWQDIASAPVGVVVWAYGTIEGDYGYTTDRKDTVKAVKEPTGKWRFAQPMGRHDPMFWTPDAWMPLPAAPIAAAGEG